MTSHADRVREAERAVVEAAVAQATCLEYHATLKCVHEKLDPAVDALLALRAATCSECEGYGVKARIIQRAPDWEEKRLIETCPAGCDAGRRRDA